MTIPHAARIRRALLQWHAEHGLRAPWRESRDPYACLVAAVMAQQTQMSRVLPSYERFMAAFPTIEALAAASLGEVIRVWAGMGYNTRAVRLHRAARVIDRDGWPRTAGELEKIDGIGPFTAAIIASFAFGEPAACVDTNVRRVLSRIAGDLRLDGRALQSVADAVVDTRTPDRWNQALMDYGARVCAARPKCGECVVARWCASRERLTTTKVAEARAAYAARVRRKPEPRYEGSSRYFRGRIIDTLRTLPDGSSIPLRRLPRIIANGHPAPSLAETRELVRALERHGLVVMKNDRVAFAE